MITTTLFWIACQAWLKIAWAWCKKNWQLFVGIAIPLVLMIVLRKRVDLKKVLDRTREDYEKEIELIEDSRQKELDRIDQSRKKYFSTVEEIKEKYEEKRSSLEEEKIKAIDKLLKEYADDPQVLTDKIKSLTGVSIYNK